MILTLTPNAAVDRTFTIPGFRLDAVNRPVAALTTAGGKGMNVARAYARLGGAAGATGFTGGTTGDAVSAALTADGIENLCVPIEGETRLCIAVVDPMVGTQTEINEAGPLVTDRDIARLTDQARELLARGSVEVLVLCGSLPPGAPPDLYATLIELARAARVPAVLDTAGEPLRKGVGARPWMLKPNALELEQATGKSAGSLEQAARNALELLAGGTEMVLTTRGEEGAVLVTRNGSWICAAPRIKFASAVASGDALLGTWLYRWMHGRRAGDPADALSAGVAAGAANAAVIGACCYDPGDAAALEHQCPAGPLSVRGAEMVH